jgi:hypothetical protein
VWLRYDLGTISERLRALEARPGGSGADRAQLSALEKAKTEKQPHGEFEREPLVSRRPGYILVGNLKGVGRV